MKKKLLLILIIAIAFAGCGKRIKLPTDIPQSAAGILDTTYLPLPAWTSASGIPFDQPQDVHVGFDGHIYIADTGNDRVVEFDPAGNLIAQYDGAEEPWSISQDRLMRLQVTSGNTIYIKLKEEKRFNSIHTAPDHPETSFVFHPDSVETLVVYEPTSFKAIAADPRPAADYATYFVCDYIRNKIVRFAFYEPDQLLSLGTAVPTGFDLGETMYPTGVFAYLTPTGLKLLFSQAYYLDHVQLLEGDDFTPLIPRSDSSEIYFPSWIIGKAEDIAVDEHENILVVDIAKHEVHKFSRNGVHILSFGEEGSGDKQFVNPMGIAYANRILYVADTGNNRIQRFMLSTDFPH